MKNEKFVIFILLGILRSFAFNLKQQTLHNLFYNSNRIYYRLVFHITDAIMQHKSTKMVSHNALQNRCLHTTNSDWNKTLTALQPWHHSPIIM